MLDARTEWSRRLRDYIRNAAAFRGVNIVPYSDLFGNTVDVLWLFDPEDGHHEFRVQFGLGQEIRELRIDGDWERGAACQAIQNVISEVLHADSGRKVEAGPIPEPSVTGEKLFETAPERRDAEKNAKNDDKNDASATPTAPNPETPNEGQRTEGAAMPESVGAKPVDETSTEERTRTLKAVHQ